MMPTQERVPRPQRSSAPPTTRSGDGAVHDAPAAPGVSTSPSPAAPTPPRRLRPWKKSGQFIRDQYTLTLMVGFVLALGLILGITKLDLTPSDDGFYVPLAEQETVQMETVKQTEQEVAPPPPPRPAPPVEVPNNEIVESPDLNFDASLDLDQPLDVSSGPPAPPPPADEEEETEDEIFVVVEEQPQLIGGMQSLYETIKYPPVARKAGIEGRVFVQFIVDENGDVIEATVVRGRHSVLDKEALRVVKQAKFTPGRQRGRAVKVRMSMPIIFRLEARK